VSRVRALVGASTGPRSGDRGERGVGSCANRSAAGFNGAAVRRPRRDPFGLIERDCFQHCFNGAAVRRPRRAPRIPLPAHNTELLQRGRGPETAERVRIAVCTVAALASLQRGRGPETAERPSARGSVARQRKLQRGRGPETAES
jgi:hypothetical protein